MATTKTSNELNKQLTAAHAGGCEGGLARLVGKKVHILTQLLVQKYQY
jgi:hypothetical protein